MRTVPIHSSLHRPNLILGAEADLVFAAGLFAFLVGISALRLVNISAAVVFWTISLFVFRQMAKKDPIFSQVFRRHINQKSFYAALGIPWGNPKSVTFQHLREQSKGVSDMLQYAACVDDGIILLKNGSFLAGWRFISVDTDSSTHEELAFISDQANNAIKYLGDGWMIQVDAVRANADSYPPRGASHFPDWVSEAIEEERRVHFQSEGNHYATENILYLTYRPSLTAEKLSRFAYEQTGQKQNKEPAAEKALQRFKDTLAQVEDVLSNTMRLERLRDYTEEDEYGNEHKFSPLLSYIRHAISGVKTPLLLPTAPMYLDCLVGLQDLVGGMHPQIGTKYIGVVAIDGFPQESWPLMLDILDGLPLEYRFTSRYVCMDQFTALKEINKFRKTWAQKTLNPFDVIFNKTNPRLNRDAATMLEDSEQALEEVQGGFVSAGYYSAGIVLMHEDKDVLDDWTRDLNRMLGVRGFSARIESHNCLEAWLGSHPGNGYSNLRKALLSSINFVDLLPLSSIWAGSETNPCPFYPPDSPPLFFGNTDGSTPYRFNLHFGDLGHTLIFGPTGSGKSTLLGLIAAQFLRYPNARIFAFDKGLSMFPLVTATGGTHYEIAGENSQLAFCPLRHVSNDAEQGWAEEWIANICEMQGQEILPRHRIAIHEAMKQIRTSPKEFRTMSHFYHYLQDPELKEAVQHYTRNGNMGRLLDAEEDHLGFSNFTVFEIEELMNLGEKNLIPVLLYLFHRIEKSLTGQPTVLIIDEAWLALSHPVFREKIREWLKVFRKLNCAVILATQSLSDAVRSGLLDVLVESCPTKIYLPNLSAMQDAQVETYRSLGLNMRQIEIIAKATPKREYYVVSPAGRRKINLALGPVALSFVGASGKEDLARIRELQAAHKDNWPFKWLEERNVDWGLAA